MNIKKVLGLLERVDLALIDSFYQPISNRLATFFNRASFWSAYVCACLSVVIGGVKIVIYSQDDIVRGAVLLLIYGSITFLWVTLLEKQHNIIEGKSYNPKRLFIPYGLVRVLSLVSFTIVVAWPYPEEEMLLKQILDFIGTFFQISAFYFASCTSLPPSVRLQKRQFVLG